MKKILLVAALLSLTAGVATADFTGLTATVPRTGIANSMHDMRGFGGAKDITIGAVDQKRICAFCHTPHHSLSDNLSGPAPLDYLPLWSHDLNYQTFNPYVSTTLQSVNEPDILVGPSRLCMSCHDGTIAIDTHYGIAGTSTLKNDSFNNPGVGAGDAGGGGDLANDHPIGFDYIAVAGAATTDDPVAMTATADGFINPASTLFKGRAGITAVSIQDRLYSPQGAPAVGIMTCASCHDVHNRKNGDTVGLGVNYLVMAPQEGSQMCLTCHIK